MYSTYSQTITGAQRWFYMAIAYQTRAQKLSKKFGDPSYNPDPLFACFRGYARCMQMYDACWSHIDAINTSYFRRQEYEKAKKESEKRIADFQAEKDEDFISVVGCIVVIFVGILFSNAWIYFIDWLAPLLI